MRSKPDCTIKYISKKEKFIGYYKNMNMNKNMECFFAVRLRKFSMVHKILNNEVIQQIYCQRFNSTSIVVFSKIHDKYFQEVI